MLKQINAGVLEVTYSDEGPADGAPVFLLHGFPYDIHAYDEVTPLLAAAGCRVFTPYLRGYGPAASIAASGVCVMNALSCGSSAAVRSSSARVNSRGDSWRLRI